jgi:ornithine--oxo-acid transaminase
MAVPMEGVYRLNVHYLHQNSCSYRNPLGCAVAMAALRVLVDEKLAERAEVLGEKFRAAVRAINSPLLRTVRGKGLLNAIVINEDESVKHRTAWQLCLLLKSRGVLAKPTHVNMFVTCNFLSSSSNSLLSSIRFAPPLVISEADLLKAVEILQQCLLDLDLVWVSFLIMSTRVSCFLYS